MSKLAIQPEMRDGMGWCSAACLYQLGTTDIPDGCDDTERTLEPRNDGLVLLKTSPCIPWVRQVVAERDRLAKAARGVLAVQDSISGTILRERMEMLRRALAGEEG